MIRAARTGAASLALALALPASVWLTGCGGAPDESHNGVATTRAEDVVFRDVTAESGIDFVHFNGRSGKKYLPETLGPGLAFLDYDNDSYPDLYIANGRPLGESSEKPTPRLYHNKGDGTFEDKTAEAGLATTMFGLGVAFGDIDNDGFDDLYVTALGGDRLYRNLGDGRFADVTAAAGIANANFGTSAAFLDFDHDGLLDLFVDNYVQWSPEADLFCTMDGETKTYCTPESYQGTASKLYRNKGDGTFEDVSEAAGIADPTSKALGVAVLDFDGDGWEDLFQANDTEPNKLYRNKGDGTFEDVGLSAGVAFGEDGRARGAMGVDAADFDGSGRPHLLVGNFSNEMVNLYHNEGGGLFVDSAPRSELGQSSLLTLTFGAFFFDYNLDGRQDIFCANGHLDPTIEAVQPKVKFAQSPQLYRNLGEGRFSLANDEVGEDFSKPLVARGAAYADIDGDGDLDIAIAVNDGPLKLLRNDGGNANSYLRVRLVGDGANRDGFGAKVSVKTSSKSQTRVAKSGSSYCSQSENVLTFGLGPELSADEVQVVWPGGASQSFQGVQANREIVIRQTGGLGGT
ncbi:MAG: CRTAC1 family protein [Acidobacteria bacterium]|nr:CRTAC1 family protein [Acidobacteriota bacterium]